MKKEDFEKLSIGDIVRHKINKSISYVVTGNYGGRVTAVKIADLTNPDEWELTHKCTHVPKDENENQS